MKLKQLSRVYLDLPLTSDRMKQHFDNPYNYTREILEQFEHDYYQDIIPQDTRTMLDIGSNIGLFALHVSTLPVLNKLVCVEPTPAHFFLLEENTEQFHFIRRENCALAGHTGSTPFYTCGINTTMNSLHKRDTEVTVPCLTLQELMNRHSLKTVDFVKIDIEGSEDVAVTLETLAPVRGRIKKVFIELHPPTGESQDKWGKILEESGYSVKKMFHDSLMGEAV